MGKNISGYGNFGSLVDKYVEARKEFPEEVLDYLLGLIKTKEPAMLDVGCGTGISTRQLAKRSTHVFGLDRDPGMIKQARREGPDGIKYVVAPVSRMPFETGQFDAVTAFSAFHWFTDKESVNEIRRVIKKGGIFLAVNKSNQNPLLKEYRRIISKFIQGDIPSVKSNYDPSGTLKSNGFEDVSIKTFEKQYLSTISQAIAYPQSMSIWNLVPQSKRQEALSEIERYCKSILKDNFVENNIEIVTVVGVKED
jgi:ubiquinone/menaquinone biosynthesis C-methylase UbiE